MEWHNGGRTFGVKASDRFVVDAWGVEPEPVPARDWRNDDAWDLDPEQCRTCGGDLMLLGQLGRLLHFRCRHCGLDCSRPVDVDPADLRDTRCENGGSVDCANEHCPGPHFREDK